MNNNHHHKLALFLGLLFITIIAAPSVMLSMDDNADVTIFFGENEEEEKESLKLLFDVETLDTEQNIVATYSNNSDQYFFKKYPLPHRNLVSPPPDLA